MVKVKAENREYYDRHKKHPFLNLAENSIKGILFFAGGAILTGLTFYGSIESKTPMEFPANTGMSGFGLAGIGGMFAGLMLEITAIPDFIHDLQDNHYLRRSLS